MEWKQRKEASLPFQAWRPFPKGAIVQIRNVYGETRTGIAGDFCWDYWQEFGDVAEGVITMARRLDKPRAVLTSTTRSATTNPDGADREGQ